MHKASNSSMNHFRLFYATIRDIALSPSRDGKKGKQKIKSLSQVAFILSSRTQPAHRTCRQQINSLTFIARFEQRGKIKFTDIDTFLIVIQLSINVSSPIFQRCSVCHSQLSITRDGHKCVYCQCVYVYYPSVRCKSPVY